MVSSVLRRNLCHSGVGHAKKAMNKGDLTGRRGAKQALAFTGAARSVQGQGTFHANDSSSNRGTPPTFCPTTSRSPHSRCATRHAGV